MKKALLTVLVLVLTLTLGVALVACADQEELHVTAITAEVAEGATFKVGDAFDAELFVVKATLSDDSVKEVTTTAALAYDKSGLSLVDGKYSKAGEVTLKISFSDFTTELKFKVEA